LGVRWRIPQRIFNGNAVSGFMSRKKKWWLTGVLVTLVLAVAGFWVSSDLASCRYSITKPAYSSDGRFYSQFQYTACKDPNRSRGELLMGRAGDSSKYTMLRFGRVPEPGVTWKWHEGPELHVQVAASAITERYGPYEELPPVIVTEN
jgi:hypothetical protein